jgi:transposase
MLAQLFRELQSMSEKSKALLARIIELAKLHPAFEALLMIPGVGPVVASALIAALGDGHQFSNGRQVGAWIGLVPRQHGTGGKIAMMGITKNGDRYLRTLLIHGARAAIYWSKGKDTPLGRWVSPLLERRGTNKAVVALANKIARISWVVLATGKPYDAKLAFGRS